MTTPHPEPGREGVGERPTLPWAPPVPDDVVHGDDLDTQTRSADPTDPAGAKPWAPPTTGPAEPPRPPAGHRARRRHPRWWVFAGVGTVLVLGSSGLTGAAFGSTRQTDTLTHAITAVQVNGDSGDVTVIGGAPAGTVEVTRSAGRLPGTSFSALTPDRQTGDVLVLDSSSGCTTWLFGCSADYTLRVPDGTAVTVDSDSGDVEVQGGLGAVVVKADSGDVDATNLVSPRVQAVTDSGDVDLSFSTAPTAVIVQADSGDVDVKVPSSPSVQYDVTAETDSGDTDNSLGDTDGSRNTIQVKTDSGDVDLGYR